MISSASSTLAYLAGFFDGDGHVIISRRRASDYSRGVLFLLQAGVSNTNRDVLEEFHDLAGGGCIHSRKQRQNFEWIISARAASRFLQAVYPYLRLKQTEVEVALKFQEGKVIRSKMGDAEFAQEESFYDQMRELKKSRLFRVPQDPSWEVAYLAGFFDAEGNIRVATTPVAQSKRGVYHKLDIAIGQKAKGPCGLFQSHWGGTVNLYNYYFWRASAHNARQCLQDMLPFLRLKREEANIAIEFQLRKSRRRPGEYLSAGEFAWRELCVQRLKVSRDNRKTFNEWQPPVMPSQVVVDYIAAAAQQLSLSI